MLRSTGWFSRSTWTTWSWSRRQQTKGMHYRLIVINFYELNSCHLTVSVGSTKLLTDCTGSKWCETLLKRTPVTHSSGKLTGGARTKPCKTTAFYFVLESNSGRFSNEKKSGWRAQKWSPEKTFGFEHFRWWSRNDELSSRLSTTDCNAWVRPIFLHKTSFQDVFRCISWFGKYIIIILWK